MKAAVFVCRAHGANLAAYRGLLRHPQVGHSEVLPRCCSEEGRDQMRLHLLGGTTQALLVLGCAPSELKGFQELAASVGIQPTRVAVVPFQMRTAHPSELALARILDAREPSLPSGSSRRELLLVGEGASAEAAHEQAASAGLEVLRLTPGEVDWSEARLTGGCGDHALEAGEVIHRFGRALLAFDLTVTVESEVLGEGDTVVALSGGEECLASFVTELENALVRGGKVYAVVQETPFSGRGEVLYRDLQSRGITFLRASELELVDGIATIDDEHLGERVRIKVGHLVTVSSFRPVAADEVMRAFGLPASRSAIGPVPGDSGRPGVHLCGSALVPHQDDPAMMARATVVSLIGIMGAPVQRVPLARIDSERCSKCLTCLRVCPYGAPSFDGGEMSISPGSCQGCGLCLALCPSLAIEMPPADLRAEAGRVYMGGGLR